MNSHPAQNQQGVMLIEALVAIVVFSIGVLALAGLYATAIKQSADAKSRGEAAYLANQIIAHMWVDRADLADYTLNSSASLDSTCSGFSAASKTGSGQGVTNLNTWLGDAAKKGTVLGSLPNAKAQVKVETGTNVVAVTLCWKAPQETEWHNFTSTALISG
jgi:type IV pilus assembly protein PilV